MILTDLERLLLGFTGCGAAIVLAGLAIDDRLRRRAERHGWTRAANRLARTQHELRAIVEQHEHHLAHLAAEQERLRAQLATRPPSDHTVRLGVAAPGRTARLARVDPWPTNGRAS